MKPCSHLPVLSEHSAGHASHLFSRSGCPLLLERAEGALSEGASSPPTVLLQRSHTPSTPSAGPPKFPRVPAALGPSPDGSEAILSHSVFARWHRLYPYVTQGLPENSSFDFCTALLS